MGSKIIKELDQNSGSLHIGTICNKTNPTLLAKLAGNVEDYKLQEDNTILKYGKRCEVEFYEDIAEGSKGLYASENEKLKLFIPKFMEIIVKNNTRWIKMESFTLKFKFPSYFEIKLGDMSYSPDDPPLKIEAHIQKDKETTVLQHGIRFGGMMIIEENFKVFKRVEKNDSKTLESISYVCELFQEFISHGNRNKANIEARDFYIKFIMNLLNLFTQTIKRCFF